MAEQSGIFGQGRIADTKGLDNNVQRQATRLSARPIASFSNRESNAIRDEGRSAQRSIQQLAKLSGDVFGQQIEKQATEDVMAGAQWAAENKTLLGLEMQGASTKTIDSFRSAKSLMDLQKLEINLNDTLVQDAGMTPGAYQKKVRDNLSGLLDTAGDNPANKAVLLQQYTALAAKSAGKHQIAHNKKNVETYKGVLSETITGAIAAKNPKIAEDLIRGLADGKFDNGLTAADRQEVIVGTALKGYMSDDPRVGNMLTKMSELHGIQLTTAEHSAMKAQKTAMQNRLEAKGNSQMAIELQEIRLSLKQGGPKETFGSYLERETAIYAKHNIPMSSRMTAAAASTFTTAQLGEEGRIALEDKKNEQKLWDSERGQGLITRIAQQETDILTNFLTGDGSLPTIQEAVNMKRELYIELGMENVFDEAAQKRIITVQQSAAHSQLKSTAAAHKVAEAAEATRAYNVDAAMRGSTRKADGKPMTNPEIQQSLFHAQEHIRDQAQKDMAKDPANAEAINERAMNDITTMIMKSPVVDKQLAQTIQTVLGTGSIVDKDGVVRPEVEAVQKQIMRMSRIDPKKAMEYFGKSDQALIVGQMILEDGGNLQQKYLAWNTGEVGAVTEEFAAQRVANSAEDIADAVSDNHEKIADNLLNVSGWNNQVEGSFTRLETKMHEDSNLGEIDQITKIAQVMAANNPRWGFEAIAKAASAKYYKDITVFGGSKVKRKPGFPSALEQMDLNGITGDNIENKAMMAMLADPRTGIDQWPAPDTSLFSIEDSLEEGQAMLRKVPPIEAQTAANGLGIVVRPAWATETEAPWIYLSYEQMGEAYIASLAN